MQRTDVGDFLSPDHVPPTVKPEFFDGFTEREHDADKDSLTSVHGSPRRRAA
ncbi:MULTISPECIES: hypothetical protein [unclassified Streptomyces]|uniref:hypothetical protein n=1 Tax=unclassified Streptomyces TaxID=2593676 RepID=UPI00161CE8A1|nr:hypothetical protein [Streptomyces sp. I6]